MEKGPPTRRRSTLFLALILLLSPFSVGGFEVTRRSVQACDEYAADRVTVRTPEDRQEHQMLFDENQDLFVAGDFDGDSRVDEAFFVENAGRYALFVCLDDGRRAIKVRELPSVAGYGVQIAPPGIYFAACVFGYFPCKPGQIAELELDHDGINVISYERFSWMEYVSGGKFRRIYTSD